MFGYRISSWRNEWKRKLRAVPPVVWGVTAFLAVVVIVLSAAIVTNASAPVSATSTSPEGTEYCYTSEDGNWLICRLED